MTSAVVVSLADEIAEYLRDADMASCDAIARALHRRRTDVLAVLREDERFVQSGRYKATRWNLAGTDSGMDNAALGGGDAAPESPLTSDSGERPSLRCVHRGGRAHYRDEAGDEWCIRCDGAPVAPLLTYEDWLAGRGSEEALNRFSIDLQAVLALSHTPDSATPEQVERMRFAFAEKRANATAA